MMEVVLFDKIEEKVIELRGEKVILDSDVAELYGVETKRINEAVKNNSDRFPDGYIIETTSYELDYLRSKFSTAKFISPHPLKTAIPFLVFNQLDTTKQVYKGNK